MNQMTARPTTTSEELPDVALRPDSLNLISICTGGGGLDLGIELAIPCARSVCLVEREAFGVSQLVSAMQQGLMAQAPVWSDARTFDGRAWRGAVDGLIGGIPCQPHSLAGKRLEREDPRDLWSTARRIIVQSGAWFVLIENVGGMLSSGGAERVHRDLGRLGFAREVGLFTASEVGASHQRERTFILAVADRFSIVPDRGRSGGVQGSRIAHERETRIGQRSGDDAGDSGEFVADADDPRSQGRRHGDRSLGRQDQERHAGLGGGELGNASSIGRNPRRGHGAKGYREAEQQFTDPDKSMDDASIARSGRISVLPGRQVEASSNPHRSGQPMVDAISVGRAGRQDDALGGQKRRDASQWPVGLDLFPAGPSDISSWRDTLERAPELEPAFRRVADGLASRLDTARVDRLRMLGNGVVPLQAAYAVRTLATRLASRGSAGAARLVRMMTA